MPDDPDKTARGTAARGFGHERLVVYRKALEFYGLAFALARRWARRDARLADQLRLAAASIPLNIAEGSGEFRSGEKARFYRIALRSATECAAVLDLLHLQSSIHPQPTSPTRTPTPTPTPTPAPARTPAPAPAPAPKTNPRALLSEIVAMLTTLSVVTPSNSNSNSPSPSNSNS